MMKNGFLKVLVFVIILLSFPLSEVFPSNTESGSALTKREIILTGRKNKIELATPRVYAINGLVTVSFENVSTGKNVVDILILDERGDVIFDRTFLITTISEVNISIDLDSLKRYSVEIHSKDMDLYGDIS
jgi:hypothetical protein